MLRTNYNRKRGNNKGICLYGAGEKLGRCFMILCFTLKQSCATIAYSLVVFDIALDGDIELAKPSRQNKCFGGDLYVRC